MQRFTCTKVHGYSETSRSADSHLPCAALSFEDIGREDAALGLARHHDLSARHCRLRR